jgi:hypothetical protein
LLVLRFRRHLSAFKSPKKYFSILFFDSQGMFLRFDRTDLGGMAHNVKGLRRFCAAKEHCEAMRGAKMCRSGAWE